MKQASKLTTEGYKTGSHRNCDLHNRRTTSAQKEVDRCTDQRMQVHRKEIIASVINFWRLGEPQGTRLSESKFRRRVRSFLQNFVKEHVNCAVESQLRRWHGLVCASIPNFLAAKLWSVLNDPARRVLYNLSPCIIDWSLFLKGVTTLAVRSVHICRLGQ